MPPTEPHRSLPTTSGTPGDRRLGSDATGRRFHAATLLSASLVALLGIAAAACSSDSTSASTSDAVVHQSGTTSKTISSVDLPKKWSVTWKFDCTNPVTARRFVLTAKETGGGSPITVTDQTGLGGGGTKVYSQTGTFDFTVTTSCTWHLSVGSASSTATTTTRAP